VTYVLFRSPHPLYRFVKPGEHPQAIRRSGAALGDALRDQDQLARTHLELAAFRLNGRVTGELKNYLVEIDIAFEDTLAADHTFHAETLILIS